MVSLLCRSDRDLTAPALIHWSDMQFYYCCHFLKILFQICITYSHNLETVLWGMANVFYFTPFFPFFFFKKNLYSLFPPKCWQLIPLLLIWLLSFGPPLHMVAAPSGLGCRFQVTPGDFCCRHWPNMTGTHSWVPWHLQAIHDHCLTLADCKIARLAWKWTLVSMNMIYSPEAKSPFDLSGSGSRSVEASVCWSPFLRYLPCKSWPHNQTWGWVYRVARSCFTYN